MENSMHNIIQASEEDLQWLCSLMYKGNWHDMKTDLENRQLKNKTHFRIQRQIKLDLKIINKIIEKLS